MVGEGRDEARICDHLGEMMRGRVDGKVGQDAFAVIRDAIAKMDMVAIY